jgi:hypothetical protein
MSQKLSIGFNHVTITDTDSRGTITVTEPQPISQQQLITAIQSHGISAADKQPLLSFDFTVAVELPDPASSYLDYFVSANTVSLQREQNTIKAFTRFSTQIGTIEAFENTLTISIHYNRSDRRHGFSKSVLVCDLISDQVRNLCIQNVLDLFDTILAKAVKPIRMEDVTSLSDLIKVFAYENLRSQEKRQALKADIEKKYQIGLIRGGNITRLRRFFNSMCEDNRLTELYQIVDFLTGLVPDLSVIEQPYRPEELRPSNFVLFA